MFEKENFNHIPTEYEIKAYINNDLWIDFCEYIKIYIMYYLNSNLVNVAGNMDGI